MTKVEPTQRSKGYHSVTPVLTVANAKEAIDFYKKAFGAEEREICYGPDGKQVMHAEIKIGDSIIMLNDEFPTMGCVGPKALGGSPVSLFIYVENVDSVYERAVKAGATATMPVADQFWGDRFGQLTDPYGHKWGISTHIADLTPEQIKKAQEEWAKSQMAHAK
jgi:PhnB protein